MNGVERTLAFFFFFFSRICMHFIFLCYIPKLYVRRVLRSYIKSNSVQTEFDRIYSVYE